MLNVTCQSFNCIDGLFASSLWRHPICFCTGGVAVLVVAVAVAVVFGSVRPESLQLTEADWCWLPVNSILVFAMSLCANRMLLRIAMVVNRDGVRLKRKTPLGCPSPWSSLADSRMTLNILACNEDNSVKDNVLIFDAYLE